MGKLPREYVPYLSVLGDVLGRVDTAKHTYNELNFDKLMNLGGIWTGSSTSVKYKTLDDYIPLYGIYTKMMSDKTDYALELAEEIVLTSKLLRPVKMLSFEIRIHPVKTAKSRFAFVFKLSPKIAPISVIIWL